MTFDEFINKCASDCVNASGSASTSEERHAHFCVSCRGIWNHEDEHCQGFRYETHHTIVGDYTCPMCADERR